MGLGSVGEWFWQGRQLSRLVSEKTSRSRELGEFLQRARLCAQAAQSAHSDPKFGATEAPVAPALLLYRESIFWSLCAARRKEDKSVVPEDDSFWSELDAESSVGFSLRDLTPSNAWQSDLNSEPQFLEVRRLALDLVSRGDQVERGIEAVWYARLLRVVVPVVGLLVLALFTRIYLQQKQVSLETNFPWKTSSSMRGHSCSSPRQGCQLDHYFFHTSQQESPWIEFDLEDLPSVSGVTIANRTDCENCSARAIPLVVELSDDRVNYQTVARKTRDFSVWQASFPRTQAKWLRLRVDRRSTLHLKQVRIQR